LGKANTLGYLEQQQTQLVRSCLSTMYHCPLMFTKQRKLNFEPVFYQHKLFEPFSKFHLHVMKG